MVAVINPVRIARLHPSEVVRVDQHSFVLGKDSCPELITRAGQHVALVAATGHDMTLEEWTRVLASARP
jgi:hypothetical protein